MVHVHACVMHVKTISSVHGFSTLQHDHVSVRIHIHCMYTTTVFLFGELKHFALVNVIVWMIAHKCVCACVCV